MGAEEDMEHKGKEVHRGKGMGDSEISTIKSPLSPHLSDFTQVRKMKTEVYVITRQMVKRNTFTCTPTI